MSHSIFKSSNKELTSVLKYSGVIERQRAGVLHISRVFSSVELKIFNLRAENPYRDLRGY